MHYDIYTDGACSKNPGPGGYAFVVIKEGEKPLAGYGGKQNTTNNHMELMAIVRALKFVTGSKRKRLDVTIYSDSAYCVNSIVNGYITFWELNDWKTKSNSQVKNLELWKEYLSIVRNNKLLKLRFVKVKGHSGDKYNEMVDRLAKGAIKELNV